MTESAKQREHTEPPIGIEPRYIWVECRKRDLAEAIRRYLYAGIVVPEEWISEYNEHCKYLNTVYGGMK